MRRASDGLLPRRPLVRAVVEREGRDGKEGEEEEEEEEEEEARCGLKKCAVGWAPARAHGTARAIRTAKEQKAAKALPSANRKAKQTNTNKHKQTQTNSTHTHTATTHKGGRDETHMRKREKTQKNRRERTNKGQEREVGSAAATAETAVARARLNESTHSQTISIQCAPKQHRHCLYAIAM